PLSKRRRTTRCNPSSAASIALRSKTGSCAPTRRSRPRVRRFPAEPYRPPPQPPMLLLAPISVPTAAGAPDGIAIRLPAALLRTSWRRFCNPDLDWPRPAALILPSFYLHTCERRAHLLWSYLYCFLSFIFG